MIRQYRLSDDNADIPDPLLFLAKADSILLTKELAEREGVKIDQQIRVETIEGIHSFKVRGLLSPKGRQRPWRETWQSWTSSPLKRRSARKAG